MSETEIRKEILTGIKSEFPGITAFGTLSGVIRAHGRVIHACPRGTPDIIGYMPDGRFLGIEVKTPKQGTTLSEQYDFAVRAAKAGCVIIGASSWEECREKLLAEVGIHAL